MRNKSFVVVGIAAFILASCAGSTSSNDTTAPTRPSKNALEPTPAAITFIGADASQGTDVHVDALGNTYAIGGFRGTQDFDPSPNVMNMTTVGGGSYVVKYEYTGNLKWARKFDGSSSNASVTAMRFDVDAAGNVYVVGMYSGTANFESGPNARTLAPSTNGISDYFIAKLDNSGNLLWLDHLAGNTAFSMYINAIGVSADGKVYVGGRFNGSFDSDPSSVVHTRTSTGIGGNAWVESFSTDGNEVWFKAWDSTITSSTAGIKVDSSGRIDIVFGAPEGLQPYGFGYTPGVQQLDIDGNVLWSHRIGTISENTAMVTGISVNVKNEVFVSGNFFGGKAAVDPVKIGATFVYSAFTDIAHTSVNPGAFVAKFDASGNKIFLDSIASTCNGMGFSCSETEATRVASDNLGRAYLVGDSKGPVGFNPTPTGGTVLFNSTGSYSYIVRIESDGTFGWGRQLSGPTGTSSSPASSWAEAASVSDSNVLSITGGFSGTANFDTTGGVNAVTTPMAGAYPVNEAYILALNVDGASVRPTSTPTSTVAPPTSVVSSSSVATAVPNTQTPSSTEPATTTPSPTVTTGPAVTLAPKSSSVILSVGGKVSGPQVATYFKMNVTSVKRLFMTVATKSKTICSITGNWLNGLRSGSCSVTVTIVPYKGKSIVKASTVPVSK